MPSGRLDGVSTPYWFACTAIATVGRAEQLNCVPPRCHGAGFAPELYGAPLVEGDILSAEVGAHGMFGGMCDACWTLLGRRELPADYCYSIIAIRISRTCM